MEGRPLTWLASDGNGSEVAFHPSKDCGEAQTHPLTPFLGREARFKDPLTGGFVHSQACAGHLHHDQMLLHESLDGERAPLGHGVPGIHPEVEEHLVNLGSVCHEVVEGDGF